MPSGGAPTGSWLHLTSYADAAEVLRSPHVVIAGGPTDAHFRAGTLTRLDGAAHQQGRRVASRLLKRDGHAWFRQTALFPAVTRHIAGLVAGEAAGGEAGRDPGGAAGHGDLVTFGFRVFSALTAAVIGFDTARDAAGLDDLVAINREMHAAGDSNLEALHGPPAQPMLAASIAANARLRRDHFEPALASRRRWLTEVAAGTRPEASLPHDLLTLIAGEVDPRWSDADIAFREASTAFRAGINTSTQQLVFSFDELTRWLAANPADGPRLGDNAFLLEVIQESLRLHPVATELLRVATQELTLTSGVQVPAGGQLLINVALANRDPKAFGADSDAFNPRRRASETAYPYGLAFSTGPHMCFGLPLVMGREGIDGTLVHTIRELLSAGVRQDPTRPTEKRVGTHKDVWLRYPVLAAGAPGAAG